jgi:hypothetical protein
MNSGSVRYNFYLIFPFAYFLDAPLYAVNPARLISSSVVSKI